MLSYRVVIDRQHTVPAHSRISLCQQLAHQVGAWGGWGVGLGWIGT